ncbi:MAG: putative molybdopterin biosynthesis protein [Planctomycetota bacterium]|jgi:putative molybdopterin biosynthesis protein
MSTVSTSTNQVFMNVKQVSNYLHLNEKKIYSLVGKGEIPATKITGKWMFPRELVDKWVLDSTHNGLLRDRLIIAGSDDPFLQRVINELSESLGSKALITYSTTTTRNGLDLLNANKIDICCLNWGPDTESATRHPALLQQYSGSGNWILIRALRREQGLMLSPTLDPTPALTELFDQQYRWNIAQPGSGSQRGLMEILSKQGLNIDQLNSSASSLSLREAAASINLGLCDVAPGTRALANEFHLQFLSLGWEHLDLAMGRDIWFRHLFHGLVEGIDSANGHEICRQLGGYQLEKCGKLVWGND